MEQKKATHTVEVITKSERIKHVDEITEETTFENKKIESLTVSAAIDFQIIKKAFAHIQKIDPKTMAAAPDMMAAGEVVLMLGGIQDESWHKVTENPFWKAAASLSFSEIIGELPEGIFKNLKKN
jgi:methylphosphotriester-DNA--protein-cysteine methyltransferase